MKSLRALGVALLLATIAAAQPTSVIQLSGSATVNPLPLNTPGSFTIEATVPCALNSGCGIIEVRRGSPTGPVVYSPLFCPLLLIYVGPGTPATVSWPGTSTPGTYFARIDYRDTATYTQQPPAWFPVRVDGPGASDAVLTSSGSISNGQITTFNISDVANAGATYVVAASQTTNTGFTPFAGGPFVALDMDAVYALSYGGTPPVFNGFAGTLDAMGNSAPISIGVPPGVLATGSPAAVQAGILGLGGITLTNPLTFNAN